MSDSIFIDTVVGPCRLKRSHRRTLAIGVLPNGCVELLAPLKASLDDVALKVKRKAKWVNKQREAFAEMNETRPPLTYRSGATHRYLGRQYRLKIRNGIKPGVKLSGSFFHITTPDKSGNYVKVLLDDWMRFHAQKQFSRRLAPWRAWCLNRGLPEPRLHLRSMPKRWGSSHPDGRIYLNPELIRAPSPCIDYVIAHEVCHLKYAHHGSAFFRLLEELIPNWRKIKQRLEQTEL